MPATSVQTFSVRTTDLLVALLCALLAWAAVHGMVFMFPQGIGINTDLQNYAQVLEVMRHPELFAADPVGPLLPRDPGVFNLHTMLAELIPGDNAAVSLMTAGGLAIFCHFFCWYLCGRIFFGSPSLAIVLTLVSSITWYWCFGTYWGAAHEEPVPRIFFNALLPFLILCACKGLDKDWPRYVLCLLTGCSIYIHSVSAFMCGGIFLTIFFLVPAQGWKTGSMLRHLASTAACALLFTLPILSYLSLRVTLEAPVEGAWNLVRTVFAVRFAHDWGNIWPALAGTLLHYSTQIPLFPAALAAMLLLWIRRSTLPENCRSLVRLLPLMPVGMTAVCLVCALEITLAPHLGRMPMSQEILRGTRFLVPVSLLALCAALFLVWRRLPRWTGPVLALTLAGILYVVTPDKMACAVRVSVDLLLNGEPAEEEVNRIAAHNRLELEAMQAIRRLVPQEEPVFSPDNTLSVRYVARHPLHPVHKDGIIIYYSRDYVLGWQWLREQDAFAREEPLAEIWQSTGTPWMLVKTDTWQRRGSDASLTPVFANRDWLLFHKEAVPDMSPDTVQATDAGS